MKLGSFWGITAPMLVLNQELFPKEVYEKYVSVLNITGNTVFLTDTQKELKYLLDYIESFPFSYVSEFAEDFAQLDSLTIHNGTINSQDSDLLYIAYDKIVADIGVKLIDDLHKGKFKYDIGKFDSFSQEGYITLTDKVIAFCANNTIDLSNTKPTVLKILKEYKSDEINSKISVDTVATFFHLNKALPDIITFDGNGVKLTDIDKAFIMKLLDSVDFIKGCLESVKITRHKEIPIFNTNFHTYLRRKPTSLYYMIINRFDYTKSTNAAHLRNTLAESRKDLSTLKESIDKYVVCGKQEQDILDDARYTSIINEFPAEKREFFDVLRINNYLDVNNLLVDDLNILTDMYDIINQSTLSYYSNLLGINVTYNDFVQLQNDMFAIGFYGLNLYSLVLFQDFIRSVMLITTDKIQKTEEQYAELMRVISDVQAFLDSFISIGGELNV